MRDPKKQPISGKLAESLELIDRSMEQVEADEGRSLRDAIAEIEADLNRR